MTEPFSPRSGAAGRMGLPSSRIRGGDLIRLALHGVRARGMRTLLSALGIALGAAAVVAVLGLSTSSENFVLARIAHLSTLLEVSRSQGGSGAAGGFVAQAPLMVRRIGPVLAAAGAATLEDVHAYRTDLVPAEESNGLITLAADVNLLAPLEASMSQGRFLTVQSARLPVTVLGAVAAQRLGIDRPGVRIRLGDRWFVVGGVLAPVDGAPQVDDSVIIGMAAATAFFAYDGGYTALFVRTVPDQVDPVASVIPATVDPSAPQAVQVVEASSLVAVTAATRTALGSLVLGLGAVSLVVGGLGVANTMIVAVLERRTEISLRRALGARRRHIAAQFLVEATVVSAAGGVVGTFSGVFVVAWYAALQQWPVSFPWYSIVGPLCGALAIGVVSGLHPANKAARVTVSDVLRGV